MRGTGRILLGLACSVAFAPPAGAITAEISCSGGTYGYYLSRGIVVTRYPGNNVRNVQLSFSADTSSFYGLKLTIHRGSFDGPMVGAPAIIYFSESASASTYIAQTFDFAGAPVTPGDNLAMTLEKIQGTGTLYTEGGSSFCPIGTAYVTGGTTPPLDTEVAGVDIGINQDDIVTDCVPSDTVLCMDDIPGDNRFQATVSFATSQNGGLSGDGQTIVTSNLGVNQGGLFWFFSQGNPEMLVKVLDGFALNGHIWVFYSAGTNVGFTLTVRDYVTTWHTTYTNPDIHAATPVQDTAAMPCFSAAQATPGLARQR